MKKIVIADFDEFNDKSVKLGNSHYAECFADDGYEVLWVSPSWNKMTYFKNKQRYYNKKSISDSERHEVKKNIYGFSACSKKLYGNYFFAKNAKRVLNGEKYITPNIRETFEKLEFLDVDILWISNLKQYWLTNVVNYKTLIYRMPDDASEFKIYPESILKIEEQLLKKSDIIFVTSKKLLEKVNNKGFKANWLPNGSDYEHFQNITFEPEEYKNCKKPKIIYIGAVGYWFDDEIIENISNKLDVEVFIIGNCSKDISKLKSINNVHMLGAKSYDIIPNYLYYADVAIIPFKKSDFVDAINPIKLFEYCAAGIPVVCSDMEEVRKLKPPVYIAHDKDDFIKGLNYYINNKDINIEDIKNFGYNNSWNYRYSYIKDILEKFRNNEVTKE